ncbi:MAG: peptide-methionine (S)-S-oxide reductase MsrA [Pseudomonadota bacterium]
MKNETAILAGGCFWGMEDLFRKQRGVTDTEVGYTGGDLENPTYNDVKTGQTGHAEAIKLTYDPSVTGYEDILKFFFQLHDPTTKDRQGNDMGSQYRSAIFYLNDEQKNIAEKLIVKLDASGKWPGPIVTEVVSAGAFTPAEDSHQDYLERYPTGYTCHFIRPEWTTD